MRRLLLLSVAGVFAVSQAALAVPAVGPAPGATAQAPATGMTGATRKPGEMAPIANPDGAGPSMPAPDYSTTTTTTPAPSTVEPSGPFETLPQALVAAYNTNPNLLAARAQLRALDETIPLASSGWKPTITLSGSYGDQFTRTGSDNSPAPRSEANPLQGQAQISQPLFRGGRTFFGVREAKANVRAGRARLHATEQQTLLGAVTAYFNVIRDTATVDLATNNVSVLQKQLDASQDRFRVGEITRTDVAQAEARVKLAETTLIQAKASLVASRDAYKTFVGHEPGQLDKSPQLPALPPSEQAALDTATRNSPTLVAARETEKSANAAVAVAYGALAPSVTVVGTASHQEGQGAFLSLTGVGQLKTDTMSVTGQLNVPLYQAGTEYASIRQAKHTASQDRLLTAQAGRDVEETVANAWEAVLSTDAAITSNQEQVNANKIAYDGVVQEAQVGSRTTLDVLNAEQELLNSQVSLVQSQRDHYVAAFSLLSSVGQLTAQQLGLPVDVYDPEANTNSLKWKQVWPGAGE